MKENIDMIMADIKWLFKDVQNWHDKTYSQREHILKGNIFSKGTYSQREHVWIFHGILKKISMEFFYKGSLS
jgi:hypothetical protein